MIGNDAIVDGELRKGISFIILINDGYGLVVGVLDHHQDIWVSINVDIVDVKDAFRYGAAMWINDIGNISLAEGDVLAFRTAKFIILRQGFLIEVNINSLRESDNHVDSSIVILK